MDEDDDFETFHSPHRYYEIETTTTNPRVYRITRYFRVLDCSYCPPHRVENDDGPRVRRYERYKSARKGRCSGKHEPPFRDTDGLPAKQFVRSRPRWWNNPLYYNWRNRW